MADRATIDVIARRKLVRDVWPDKDVQGSMLPLHLQSFPRGSATGIRGQGQPIAVDEQLHSSRLIDAGQEDHMREYDKIAPRRKC